MRILEGGVSMHTGTTPAERFRSSLLEMLLESTRNVFQGCLEILLQLCYLRYT